MKEYDAKKKILVFFRKNEGKHVSGEEISHAMGFSRAGAWKYISKLREDGYNISAVPNRGYCLESGPDKVYGYDIAGLLNTKVIGKRSIHHYDKIDSTNSKAYELAETGVDEGTIVIAESQTHGRGRLGRKWVSPEPGGVYMSIILRPDLGTDEIPAITIVAAGAVARTIKKVCGLDPGIKWPNDILINGKKICGILTEIKAQPDMVDFLVLGIGVNVNTSSEKLPEGSASLKELTLRTVDRAHFIRILLEELEHDYLKFNTEGFSPLREGCKALSIVIGRKVEVTEHHRRVKGEAIDIDEKGALVVKNSEGDLQRVFSGDVEVR